MDLQYFKHIYIQLHIQSRLKLQLLRCKDKDLQEFCRPGVKASIEFAKYFLQVLVGPEGM